MRYSPEIDAAKNHERVARGWMSSCWLRVAILQKRLQASQLSSDGNAARVGEELATARRIAIAASEDVAGWKRVVKTLNGS
jgi:hypothetical protein